MTAPAPLVTHPTATAAWFARRDAVLDRIYVPTPTLTLSEWADRHRVLQSESSAEPGRWRTDRVPYLREIMDAASDPAIGEMVIMKAAQVGYTQGILLNLIAYHIHQDPAPILVVQPSDGEAEKFSKEKLAPMIRDMPLLVDRVSEAKGRDSGNTILAKSFPGGFLGITGATSPKGLRSRTSRILLFDEVDGYPQSAAAEGDPISLARKRALTFYNRKVILGSSPTVMGVSRIEAAFSKTDQRVRFWPCPHCGTMQAIEWGGPDVTNGLRWDPDDASSAHYVCLEGCVIEEAKKSWMDTRGEWRPANPGARIPGWHISGLLSPFEGASWTVLVQEWLDAQRKPEMMRAFWNTGLGLPWEERGERVDPGSLFARLEPYPAPVPAGVKYLTRSVDVQGDRVETTVWGWGIGEECWLIAHDVIPGDPGGIELWDELTHLRATSYRHLDGTEMRPRLTGIDSGGHHASQVYAYCKRYQRGGCYALKGANTEGAPLVSKASPKGALRGLTFMVGVFTAKEALAARLRLSTIGPGYIHLPMWLQKEQAEQLTAEELKTIYVKGLPRRIWKKTRDRNEMTDLWGYAFGMLYAMGPRIVNSLAKAVAGTPAPAVLASTDEKKEDVTPEPPTEPAEESPRRSQRRNFINSWGW